MDFNDIMVVITGILCFLAGILLVPLINLYLKSATGFSIPAALTGVVDLLLIIGIVWIHTVIVLYHQKKRTGLLQEKKRGY